MPAERQKHHAKAGEAITPEQPKDKRADYLTARQLADVLQVSEATIHRLRRAGRIPAVLLTDRLIRFNLRDVQKALRPQSASHSLDGSEAEQEQEPSPQLSFEDLLSDSGKTETAPSAD
ncbi:MAG: helix-turn-helix domain-containing protein [Acidobacteriota bacterium]